VGVGEEQGAGRVLGRTLSRTYSKQSAIADPKLMPPLLIRNTESLKEFVGQELGVTGWFTVTQERVDSFAEATEDRQWIHLEQERAAKESTYGGTIAHGFLTLSLISYFVKEVVEVEGGIRFAVNYGLNRVRFPAPVKVGANIRARVVLAGLKDVEGGVEAAFTVTVETENNEKPCCVAEWLVRYYE
jgi:acyl dehydratase